MRQWRDYYVVNEAVQLCLYLPMCVLWAWGMQEYILLVLLYRDIIQFYAN